MFDFIGQNQDTLKVDFITWTGDNSPHNTWQNSNEEVASYVRNITETLKQSLGPDSKIEVFPALGNHDTWPINVEDLSTPNSNLAINSFKTGFVADHWLSQDEADAMGRFGFYSKQLFGGEVLALNTQACNSMNWWLFKNREDPGGQMEWLEQRLANLEETGRFAYIIGHIPPHECLH